MKTVLILVLSADVPPYDKMINTAQTTWDSIQVPGTETIYYCGQSGKSNTDQIIYLPLHDHLFNIGHKTIAAFQWALNNKTFDYIARVHSSIYVNKQELVEFVQDLPDTNIFSGIEASSQNGFQYIWGGTGYIISRDVTQLIIDNKDSWDHAFMEDESMSLLVRKLGIPFYKGNRACSIEKTTFAWQCISYCQRSLTFKEFKDLKPLKHFYYRVKQDGDRDTDAHIMRELFEAL